MEQLMTISNVRCYEENGTAFLNLEDVARGLGFTQTAHSGNEVVRWERVNKYLQEFGIPTSGDGGFIPENIFYRLAMKAKNAVAEAFQAKVADEIIPSIRKHGMYMPVKKLNPVEMIKLQSEAIIELDEKIKETNKKIEDFRETLPVFPIDLQRIKREKNKVIVPLMGGKESAAYRDCSLRQKTYRDLEKEIWRQFDIESTKELQRNQVSEAIEVVRSYELPRALKEQIKAANAQMRMEL